MDLGETIRKQVLDAVDAALKAAPKNIATATNVSSATTVSRSGHTVSVYVDDEVTIVERDGKRRVIRHDEDDAEPGGGAATGQASGGEGAEPTGE
jgi:hypothetical protein